VFHILVWTVPLKAGCPKLIEAYGVQRALKFGSLGDDDFSFKLFGAIDATRGWKSVVQYCTVSNVIELHDVSVFRVDGSSIDNVLADMMRRVVAVLGPA